MVSGTDEALRFAGSPLTAPPAAGSSAVSPGLTVNESSLRVTSTRIQWWTVTRSSNSPLFTGFTAAAMINTFLGYQRSGVPTQLIPSSSQPNPSTSLSTSLYHSLSLYHTLSLPLSLSLSTPLSATLSLYSSLYHTLCLPLSTTLSLSTPLSTTLSVYLSLPLSLSLLLSLPHSLSTSLSTSLCHSLSLYSSLYYTLSRSLSRFKVQGFFICHMINYTGYNQKWNVGQIRSAQWTVQRIKK